jgi:hypothetical protein
MKKTTLRLSEALIQEVKLRAIHEGKKLQDAVASLLRKGLDADPANGATVVKADKAMLKRRREIAEKFISGEWGVELAGFEAGRVADRRAAAERDARWRK